MSNWYEEKQKRYKELNKKYPLKNCPVCDSEQKITEGEAEILGAHCCVVYVDDISLEIEIQKEEERMSEEDMSQHHYLEAAFKVMSEKWNTRPEEERLRQENERLREALNKTLNKLKDIQSHRWEEDTQEAEWIIEEALNDTE